MDFSLRHFCLDGRRGVGRDQAIDEDDDHNTAPAIAAAVVARFPFPDPP
jgi:hypothetical protein